jgi:hypothetical protein
VFRKRRRLRALPNSSALSLSAADIRGHKHGAALGWGNSDWRGRINGHPSVGTGSSNRSVLLFTAPVSQTEVRRLSCLLVMKKRDLPFHDRDACLMEGRRYDFPLMATRPDAVANQSRLHAVTAEPVQTYQCNRGAL